MSTKFKTLLSLAAVAAFFVSAAALADFRDYNDKAWNSIYKREHSVATARSNRVAAPVIMRSQTAPTEVAQAPAKERAYSYEPSTDASASTPCGGKATSAPNTAQKATSSNRSFSYEPATSGAPRSVGRSRNSGTSGFSIDVGRRAKGY
jgi:hypothetical protein